MPRARSPRPRRPPGVSGSALAAAITALTGDIVQVPPSVSAIKVGGQRAYRLTRAGAAPALAPRPVTVYEFTVTATRPAGDRLDVDVTVRCSSGTYIRALARDLGAALGTGGHLTRLRRTRVGGYGLDVARTLEELAERFEIIPLAEAAAAGFPRRDLSADEARRLAHGARLPAVPPANSTPASTAPASSAPASSTPASSAPASTAPSAAYAPDGSLVALLTEQDGQARPLVVFA